MQLSLLLKLAVSLGPQILVQSIATNRFLFVTFKDGAGHGILQFADVHRI
jgi:hypothetical protein